MNKKLTRKEKFQQQAAQPVSKKKGEEKSAKSQHSLKRSLGWILAVLAIVLYANTFGNEYVLDDYGLIPENTITKQGIKGIPEIFKTSYRTGMNMTDYSLYRPLSKATFAIEWSISPHNPQMEHMVNVFLFAISVLLLFHVLTRYLKGNLLLSFLVTALFAAHPIHTEVVANIKSRDEILTWIFLLLSLRSLHIFVTTDSKRSLFGGVIYYFIALFSKESAITFIFLAPLFLWFFTDTPRAKYFAITGYFMLCTLIFMLIRRKVLGSVDVPIPVIDNYLAGIKNSVTRETSAIFLLGVYLKLLFFPNPLAADGSYNHFPAIGITDWRFFVPFIILAALFIFGCLQFKKKNPLAFGILFFFVSISIVSNVFFLIGTNYGERLLFVPSFGFCFCIGWLIEKLARQESTQQKFEDLSAFLGYYSKPILITGIIVVLFGVKTFARNSDWHDNLNLYLTDLKNVPESAHLRFYIANHITSEDYLKTLPDSAARKKSEDEALAQLTESIRIFPAYADAYQRRAFIYYQRKDYKTSEPDFIKSLSINPTQSVAMNNYGSLLFNTSRFADAKENFEKALRYNPRYADASNNLGSVFGVYATSESAAAKTDPANSAQHQASSQQYFDQAIACFQKAVQIDPDFSGAYHLLSVTYQYMGDAAAAEQAERLSREAKARKERLSAKN